MKTFSGLAVMSALILGIWIGFFIFAQTPDPRRGEEVSIGQPRSGVAAAGPADLRGTSIVVPANQVGVITAPLPGGRSVALIAQITLTSEGVQISIPDWSDGPPEIPVNNILGRRR